VNAAIRKDREAVRLDRISAITKAVAELERRGTCWADWAREHGFSRSAVRNVRRGRGPCIRGEAYAIARQVCAEAACPAGPPSPKESSSDPALRQLAIATAAGCRLSISLSECASLLNEQLDREIDQRRALRIRAALDRARFALYPDLTERAAGEAA